MSTSCVGLLFDSKYVQFPITFAHTQYSIDPGSLHNGVVKPKIIHSHIFFHTGVERDGKSPKGRLSKREFTESSDEVYMLCTKDRTLW